jgi:hypothetical protein
LAGRSVSPEIMVALFAFLATVPAAKYGFGRAKD